MATNKEIIALVQAGDLEGAAAAIKDILNQKKDSLVSEARVFIASSIFEAKACNEEDEDEDGEEDEEITESKGRGQLKGVDSKFTDLKSWSDQAKHMGLKVTKGVRPDGEDGEYWKAKDKQGNNIGDFTEE